METATQTPLHERLRIAAGSRTYRQMGDLTGTNHETVRRYMLGQAPSADFLAAACEALDLNAQWLLVGAGPMKRSDIRSHALGEAKVSELLTAMSNTLESLISRVDRLETYVQTLETHLRVHAGDDGTTLNANHTEGQQWANNPPIRGIEAPGPGIRDAQTNAQQGPQARAADVADAVPKRPRPPAR